ncbi:MAG: cellulase family glycosylhydrolase [Nitrospiraceae bacterium]
MTRFVVTFALVATVLIGMTSTPAQASPQIGLAGDRFTVNGQPTFLLGISYFDALNWHLSDLDALKVHRFNLIRIFLDWNSHEGNGAESAFDQQGNFIHEGTISALVQAAAARGIIVDVTILHAYSDAYLTTSTVRQNAVRNTVQALANEPNVFFDLINEHEESSGGPPDWSVSHNTVQTMFNAARQGNPNAILLVSSAPNHLMVSDVALQINPANLDAELMAGSQVLTPHFERDDLWYDLTDQRVGALKSYLATIGRANVPVYLQEENRRGFVNNPPAMHFIQAASEAHGAGAAGWVFHTAAGFDLGSSTFFQALDSEEQQVVNQVAHAVLGPSSDISPPAPPTGLRISQLFTK